MSVVEAVEHQVSDAAHVQKPVHRFLVLKDCEGAFKRELEMQDALRVLITRCEERAITFNLGKRRLVWRCFLFRWPETWAVHCAQMAIHSRNLGTWEARKSSLKMLSLFVSPDWLSHWIGRRLLSRKR